ncbi:MAG TPA: undecaprenyl-diphosphate phosphatase [Candidatus Paceibacterota bacterium]
MGFLDAVILGIVEGFTEFLPISSTGHLILASSLLGLTQTDFLKSFEIAIQLGAILAVVALYWRKFLDIEVLKRLAVAFIPTGIIGLLLYRIAKTYLIGNETVVVWALLIGGITLIAFEYFHTEKQSIDSVEAMTYRQSALVGLFQAVAIIPGVSRSAATILGGLALGLHRTTIVEFAFLLAVPTMLAATCLDLLKSAGAFRMDEFGILAIGFVVSFAVALASIKFLLHFVRRYTFTAFGVYRILIALVFLFWLV